MSSDGAMYGVSAGDALKVILGGESEDDQVHQYDKDFEETIRNAPGPPWDYDNDGYSKCANYLARQVLEWLEKDTSRSNGPVESVYEWTKNEDGTTEWSNGRMTTPGWSERMKADGYLRGGMYGCTGFQWGWACNAARKILGLSAVSNPAIITIGSSDD